MTKTTEIKQSMQKSSLKLLHVYSSIDLMPFIHRYHELLSSPKYQLLLWFDFIILTDSVLVTYFTMKLLRQRDSVNTDAIANLSDQVMKLMVEVQALKKHSSEP